MAGSNQRWRDELSVKPSRNFVNELYMRIAWGKHTDQNNNRGSGCNSTSCSKRRRDRSWVLAHYTQQATDNA